MKSLNCGNEPQLQFLTLIISRADEIKAIVFKSSLRVRQTDVFLSDLNQVKIATVCVGTFPVY